MKKWLRGITWVRDQERVLGDYYEEMERRRKGNRQRRFWAGMQGLCVLGLIWWGIQPLGLDIRHQLALICGLIWLAAIVEGFTEQLADEVDLLEEKIVFELKKLNSDEAP